MDGKMKKMDVLWGGFLKLHEIIKQHKPAILVHGVTKKKKASYVFGLIMDYWNKWLMTTTYSVVNFYEKVWQDHQKRCANAEKHPKDLDLDLTEASKDRYKFLVDKNSMTMDRIAEIEQEMHGGKVGIEKNVAQEKLFFADLLALRKKKPEANANDMQVDGQLPEEAAGKLESAEI